MANRYWVGGSGTWDATTTTNWSATSGGAGGASAPGTADAVIFDANSNTGTNDFTVTLSGSPTCQTMDTTGIDPANSMTVGGSGSLTISGASLTLTSKVVWSNTGTLTFSRTAGTISITTGGVSIASNVVLTIVGSTATINFVDNFTCTGSVTVNGGTLNTTGSNKIITVAAFLFANSAAKTIALGTNARLFITGNNRTVLDLATGGGAVTWTSPGFLGLSYSGSVGTRTINMGSAGVGPAAIQITAGSDIVTFTSGDVAKAVTFSGFTGTWSNVALTMTGSLTTTTSMTIGAGSNAVTFTSSCTLVTGGATYNFPVVFSGVGATFTASGDITVAPAYYLSLVGGTIDIGSNNLILGSIFSPGASSRSITRTTGNITLTGNAATIATLTGTGFTYTAGLSLTCTYSGSTGTRTFDVTQSGIPVNVTAGSDTVTFTTGNSVGSVNFTGFYGTLSNAAFTINGSLTVSSTMTLSSGANAITFAGSGTLASGGKTFDFPISINGSLPADVTLGDSLTIGQTRSTTIVQGSLRLGANTLSTGVFTASSPVSALVTRTTGNVVVTGNNSTILTLTGNTTATGVTFTCNYSGSSGTRTLNVNPNLNRPQAILISAGSDVVTFTSGNGVSNLNFTGFSGTWSNVAMSVSSELTLSSTMTTASGVGTVTLSNMTLTTSGVQLNFPITVSTVTMADDLNSTQSVNATGSFDANNKNISISTFTSSNLNTRTIAMGSGTWTLSGNWNCLVSSGMTLTGTALIRMTSATAKTFAGGSKTYTALENAGAGTLLIQNNDNVITTVSNSVSPTGFSFDSASGGSIRVTNFNVSGTPGNLVTITRDTQGPFASLIKTSGTVSVQYCSIQSSAPTGGARWVASYSEGNINAGYNENWIFSNGSDAFFDFF